MTVRLEDVSFSYRRGHPLYEGLDVEFAAGSTTALVGASGSGKSTLLYMLGLLLRPTAGTVIFDDTNLSRLSDRQRSALRAAEIGFVFQDAALDPNRTVIDNVLEPALYRRGGRGDARGRAHELLGHYGVGLRADHRPGEVSGGQAQRVALCRALVNDPSVVLADEPTGNLDPEAAAVVLASLQALAAEGKVVVIATHDLRIAGSCESQVRVDC